MKTIQGVLVCIGLVAFMGMSQAADVVNPERERRLKLKEAQLELERTKKARLLLVRKNQQRQQQILIQKKRQALMHQQQARDRQKLIQQLELKHKTLATVEKRKQEILQLKRSFASQ